MRSSAPCIHICILRFLHFFTRGRAQQKSKFTLLHYAPHIAQGKVNLPTLNLLFLGAFSFQQITLSVAGRSFLGVEFVRSLPKYSL